MSAKPPSPCPGPLADAASVSSAFRARVAAVSAATGLTAAQLGITRIYAEAVRGAEAASNAGAGNSAEARVGAGAGAASARGERLWEQPVLMKDLQQVAGQVVTMGSAEQRFVAQHHDSAVQAVLGRGAVIVGASASAEFGTTAYTEPVGQAAPVNPLGAGFMAGGSSGGAAVAVARGLVNFAHATDGGGSIRIPAACVGIPGLKPAHDRLRGAFTPVAHGWLAADLPRTAAAYGLDPALPPVRRGLRIGLCTTPIHAACTPDPRVLNAVATATLLLARGDAGTAAGAAGTRAAAGADRSVTTVAPPYPAATFALFSELIAARCADLPGHLSPLTTWLRDRGREVPRWRRSLLEEQLLALEERVARAWQDVDVVITPTIACAPPPPGAFSQLTPPNNFQAQTAWTPWGTVWNLTGWAALSVPLCDAAPGQWPISAMIGAVDGRVSEAELLALGAELRQAAAVLGPDALRLDAPGNLDALGWQARPRNAHSHARACEHGHGHGPEAHDAHGEAGHP